MQFYISTLGCKVNQYESHALREAWLAWGGQETLSPASADVILVNSCAVTAKAVADVRHTVRRLHRSAPEVPIIITGCAAEVAAAALAKLPGVCRVVPQRDKCSLARTAPQDFYVDFLKGKLPQNEAPQDESPQDETRQTGGVPAGFPQRRREFPLFAVNGYDRSRAVVKLQDGCSHCCTYCIVPHTRGPSRSRPVADSLAEIRRLLDMGFREIGLSGVNLRQYGQDLAPAHDFWEFIRQVEEVFAPQWSGRLRLRISSLEPGQLDAKALETLAASRLVAPHLHLSLQSGSSGVLQRMGRGHYNVGGVLDFVRGLQAYRPVFALGADILTGFPGETDEEHAQTLQLCRELPLTYAHVFPYSRRPGTVAARLGAQVEDAVKKQRAKELRLLVARKKELFLRSLLDKPYLEVVPEVQGNYTGRNADDISSSRRNNRPVQGISEVYTECLFLDPQPQQLDLRIVRAAPVQVQGGKILVRLLR